MIERRKDESDFEYAKRITEDKQNKVADLDYSEWSKLCFDEEYSSESSRRMFYGVSKMIELYNNQPPKTVDEESYFAELELKKQEIQKEKYKMFDQRTALNKLLRERARQEELNEIVERAIQQNHIEFNYSNKEAILSENSLLVSLNDLHFGATFENEWGVYNSDIAKNRIEDYTNRILKIQKTHNSENCVVWCNGDNISGSLHKTIAITNKENLMEQIMMASELISNFLYQLSLHFNNVYFVDVAGNHSRLDKKDDALYDERLDDLVGWYCKARLNNVQNIKFDFHNKIDPTLYTFDLYGKVYCGIHGDIDTDISRATLVLQNLVGEKLYAILAGHMHHNSVDSKNGIKTIMSGSFQGVDSYCVTKRIYGNPEQLIGVANKEGIQCYYDIVFK